MVKDATFRRRVLVHVVTVGSSFIFLRGHPRRASCRGWEVHGIGSPDPLLATATKGEPWLIHQVKMERRISPLDDLVTLLRLVLLLRRLRPEIVHSHTPKGGLLGTVAGWLAGVPFRIYHVHGLPLSTATGIRAALLKRAETVASHLATHVLCVSESVRTDYLERGFTSPQKIRCLGDGSCNGVDTRIGFAPPSDRISEKMTARGAIGVPAHALVIGFVGRLSRDKGIEILASAWIKIRTECPSAILVLVGPKDLTDPVAPSVMQALESDSRVYLLGFREDLRQLYLSFDILVLPTYREGLPGVLLEAASMELAIVSTDALGCVDAVKDGQTGTLVPVGDSDALALALINYASADALRDAHGKAAREDVSRRFNREKVVDQHLDFYDRLYD